VKAIFSVLTTKPVLLLLAFCEIVTDLTCQMLCLCTRFEDWPASSVLRVWGYPISVGIG